MLGLGGEDLMPCQGGQARDPSVKMGHKGRASGAGEGLRQENELRRRSQCVEEACPVPADPCLVPYPNLCLFGLYFYRNHLTLFNPIEIGAFTFNF